MEREKILERISEFEKGVAGVDAQIKSMTAQIQQLTQSKLVTLGAISEAKHYLATMESEAVNE